MDLGETDFLSASVAALSSHCKIFCAPVGSLVCRIHPSPRFAPSAPAESTAPIVKDDFPVRVFIPTHRLLFDVEAVADAFCRESAPLFHGPSVVLTADGQSLEIISLRAFG